MMGMHTTQSTLRRIRGAVALLALALTFAISLAAAQQWTPKQRAACEPDAMRLCNQYVPDIQRTSACMSHYRRYLSPACRAVFYGGQRKEVAAPPRVMIARLRSGSSYFVPRPASTTSRSESSRMRCSP